MRPFPNLWRALLAIAVCAVCAVPARAAEPKVAVSVRPLHSLVAQLMAGRGEPVLLISGAGDPHSAQITPSKARALANADLVVWFGPDMTPGLTKPIATLGANAKVLRLVEAADDEAHGDDHDDDHDDDHGDEAVNGHSHSVDPHVWLDPLTLVPMVARITDALVAVDADHEAGYRQAAEKVSAQLEAQAAALIATTAPLRDAAVALHQVHDSASYLMARAGLARGHVLLGPNSERPGASGLSKMRAVLAEHPGCLLVEPQTNPALVRTLTEDRATRTVTVDTLGFELEPGPTLYPALIEAAGQALAGCVGP